MAKVKGPLLSLTARGSIAKTQTYASWRGIPYVRQLVIPANPKTTEQNLTRDTFVWLNDFFRHLGTLGLAPWSASANGRPFTNRNSFIKTNMPTLRAQPGLSDLMGSPGVLGGPALSAMVASAGPAGGAVTFTFTVPTLPAGWSLNKVAGFSILEAAPSGLFAGVYNENSYSGVNPQTFNITALTPSTNYANVGWAVYNRPDASLAYSPSITDLQISSA